MTNLEKEAMEIACKAVLEFGEGDENEYQRALEGNLWLDHPAYVAAKEMAERLVSRLS